MNNITILAFVVVSVALIFGFTNGFNDSANIVATMISTRAISPRTALWMASLFEFIGAAFLGTAVARMIAGGIINHAHIIDNKGVYLVLAALIGAIAWNICSWILALPSSSSHALVGGLVGAFVVGEGIHALLWNNLLIIALIMVVAPVAAFLLSYVIMLFIYFVGGWLTPRANTLFKNLQIVSSIGLALAHGTNDGQKTMGVITLSLVALGLLNPVSQNVVIPAWVIFSCAGVIALGVGLGARGIIHTLGRKIYKIKPEHGFCAQTSSALVMYGAALSGFIISTSQMVSLAIAGSGAAHRIKRVQWNTVGELLFAWMITMPSAAVVAAGCVIIFRISGLIPSTILF